MAQTEKNNATDFDKVVKKEKKTKKRNTYIAVFLALIVAIAGIYFCITELFYFKTLVIDEDGNDFVGEFPYTQEEMLCGLGIEKGIGLYDFDAATAQKNAKYTLSYIKEIKLKRRWPSTLVAKTALEVPSYYVSVSDDLYIVSDSLKVLEKTDSSEKVELYSLMYLECDVHGCIVGEKLGIAKDIEEILYDIDEKMTENRVKNDVTSINVSDKFNISLTYGKKYVVKLGDSKSLGTKIEFMKRIIEDRTGDTVGGVIDVSDEKNREAIYKKFN